MSDLEGPVEVEPGPAPVTAESLAFESGLNLGAGLRAAREFLGLSLHDVMIHTKVRPAYLAAIEDMDLSRLPSRPFTIGYVRAYAEALDLDPSRAVAQFRTDAPEGQAELPNPIGVDNDSDPRRGVLIMAGLAILAAIVVWNIAQHALNDRQAPPSVAVEKTNIEPAPITAPVVLGGALPPPVEATLPKPYLVPGLEKADPAAAAEAKAAAAEALSEAPQTAKSFVARGQIYGAPAAESRVTLQARGLETLLIRRGAVVVDEVMMKDGEAYRAPADGGLTVDVSMPSSMDYYVDGALKGTLSAATTPMSQLGGGGAPPAAKEAAATPSQPPAAIPTAARAAPATAPPQTPAQALPPPQKAPAPPPPRPAGLAPRPTPPAEPTL